MNRNILRKQKKSTPSRTEQYLVNLKYLGEEPKFSLLEQLSSTDYSKALSWYNYMCDVADARSYIIEYLEFLDRKSDIQTFNKVPDTFINMTSAWIARMLVQGYIIPEKSIGFFEEKLDDMFKHVKKPSATIIKFNPQDRMKDKITDFLGEIEAMVDSGVSFSLYDYMKAHNVPATYCSSVVEKYDPILQEIMDVMEGNDEQLNEAYEHASIDYLESQAILFSSILDDSKRYADLGNKTRKPRKKKVIPVSKIIAGLKYQKKDDEMNLSSVDPHKIVGANELWVYNTRYKVLAVYRALEEGLSVKGTSITNYNEDTSSGKTIGRKADEYVHRVLKDGKVSLRKLMDEIKTNNVLTNRINSNTILLKVS